MLKKIQAETLRFLAVFLMFLCLMTNAHAAFAEGASDNTVVVNGDKYESGDISVLNSTPSKDIPNSAEAVIGGIVADSTPSNLVVGGEAVTGGASSNNVVVKGGTVTTRCYGAMVGLAGIDANTSTGDAINNIVSIQNGTVNNDIYGGYTEGTGNASNNQANVSGRNETSDNYSSTHDGNVTGNIYGGYAAGNGNSESNNSHITGTVNGNVYGGYTKGTGNAKSNWASIGISSISVDTYSVDSNGSVTGNIYGGYAEGSGNAESNSIGINGTVYGNLYGGYTENEGKSSSNNVSISPESSSTTEYDYTNYNGANYTGSNYNPGGNVTGNIYGGYTKGNGNAESNNVVIMGAVDGNAYGGYTEGNGNALSNHVMIDSGTSTSDSTSNYTDSTYSINTKSIATTKYKGSVTKNIYGGYAAGSGNANDNMVYLDNTGDFSYSSTSSANDTDTNTTYTCSSGSLNIGGDIYGGYAAENGTANNNIVTLSSGVDLSSSNIYGGYSTNGASEGNTLNILGTGNKAKSINNFQNIKFVLSQSNEIDYSSADLTEEQKASISESSDGWWKAYREALAVKKGDTMLTVETANIEGAKISGIIEGDTTLTEGDTVTLLDAQTLNADENTTYTGSVAEGISFNHKLNVTRDGNKIMATIGDDSTPTPVDPPVAPPVDPNPPDPSPEPKLLEQTTIIPSPAVTAPKMLTTHMDSTINWLPSEDFAMPSAHSASSESKDESGESSKELGTDVQAEKPGYEIFGNFGTSSIRTNTGNGTYVDSKTNGINLGFARRFDGDNGARTYVAPLVDYGGGSYDSYLANGIHGKGHTHFTTGGVIARHTMNNGFYYEGSFRMGRTTMDFATDDLQQGDTYPHVAYDTSARVWAAHVNIGRRIEYSPTDVLHLYGIYFHTHQGSMEAKLTTGETYRFNSVTNQRLRIGARILKWAKPTSCFYSGIAYQWESAGAANATYKGVSTNNVGAAGSSFMAEIGWQVKPASDSRIAFDIGAVGWLGHQRGASAHVKFNYAF